MTPERLLSSIKIGAMKVKKCGMSLIKESRRRIDWSNRRADTG